MENVYSSTVKDTASGALADALALSEIRDQGANDKFATGHKLPREQKAVTPKKCLRIAEWNIRTGNHVGQREIVIRELLRYKVSLAVLSEVRITGCGQMRVTSPDSEDWMMLYYSGGEHHTEGVGFAVNRKCLDYVVGFQPVTSRIAVLTLTGTIKTHIVAVYAPTEMSSEESKDEFYDRLQVALDTLPRRDIIIMAGDLNAHIGTNRDGWNNIMGPFGYGNMNDNGFRLLSFAAANNLVISNTYFQHPLKHRLTWRMPGGKDTAILDYFLIRSRFRSSVKNVRVMRGADCSSDHHLLMAELQLRLRRNYTRSHDGFRRRDWTRLLEPTYRRQFAIELANRFEALAENPEDEEENPESATRRFAETVSSCASSICPVLRKRTQRWISMESLRLIDERKRCKNLDFQKYRDLSRTVRCRLRRERREYWNSVAADIEKAGRAHDYRTLYITLRRLRGDRKHGVVHGIRGKDGTLLNSRQACLDRWCEHFQEMLNRPDERTSCGQDGNMERLSCNCISDSVPDINEVRKAVERLRSGKTAGLDNVSAECLKAGGELLLLRLHSIIRLVWITEQIPSQWKQAVIVPIHKKGDTLDCVNYRGISLLSIVGKVFMSIIQRRIQDSREQHSREEQAGFRLGRGCSDQIFVLRQVLEERIRCGKRLVIAFVDFTAAFDSVNRSRLWEILTDQGLPDKILRLLMNTYDGSVSCVRINGELSKTFSIRSGVRQGCVLSPLLFNAVIDVVMKKALINQRGILFGDGQRITDLTYADDVAVFADNEEELTQMLCEIATTAYPYGLIINAKKTKVLTSDGTPAAVHLDNTQLEHVNSFKYLGSLIQGKIVASSLDVQNRIGLATAAFGSLSWCLWRKPNVSTQIKMRIYRALVLPILLYGSEVWTLLQRDERRLETFQMKCLRRILGVTLRDRLRNEFVRKKCDEQPTIAQEIRKRRLRWFGNVCRMDPTRIPYKVLWRKRLSSWKYLRTAPKKTWLKQVENDVLSCRLTLEEAKMRASNRLQWKRIIHEVTTHVAPTAPTLSRAMEIK